jgi:hypothetical protein
MEKISLELIEEEIRTLVRHLTSTAPKLLIVVQDGKLDLAEDEQVIFSFSTIQSQLITSQSSLSIAVTCTSNLWKNLSFYSSLNAEDLKSAGTIQLIHFRPHDLFAHLSPKIVAHIGESDAALLAKFETLGLSQIRADIKSSVSKLALFREKRHVNIEDVNIRGEIEIEPKSISVKLNELRVTNPDLKMSGKYTMDRDSRLMSFDLEGKSINVQAIRTNALNLGGDITIIRNIFEIVQGGKLPTLSIHTRGKSLDDLVRTESMRIAGKLRGGNIYIPAKDLSFHGVAGDAVISKGILDCQNIEASLENHRVSRGKLRIGLKEENVPFSLDVWIKADMENLPSFLKHKNLVRNKAILREMDRLSDIQGSAQGKLILGDRLDSIHMTIDVSQMNIIARYAPLPFPLKITGGQFSFDEKSLKIASLDGSLGNSSFSQLTAQLILNNASDLEIAAGQLVIDADEMYPWVSSFEKIKPFLKDILSVRGTLVVSSVNLMGPLYQFKDWQFLLTGEAKKLTLDSTSLPGRAEDIHGVFRITHNELSLKNIRTKILDSLLTVSGTLKNFPADIHTMDLTLQGEIGPKVTSWFSALIELLPEMEIRAPVSVTDATLLWEKNTRTMFDGRLIFGQGTRVSVSMTKTPDELSVHEITIKDRNSDVTAGIMLNKKTIDITFKGILTSNTIDIIFMNSMFSNAALQGDFRTHIIFKYPKQSTAEGILQGTNLFIPWGRDIPLVLQNIDLKAQGKSLIVNNIQLLLDEKKFTGMGTIHTSPSWFIVDIDLSSDRIDWETVQSIIQATDYEDNNDNAGLMENVPVRGTLRIRSDFLTYRQFTLEPFHADVSFDGDTVHMKTKKAALCGISTTLNLNITDQGAELDIVLSAKNLQFKPTVACLTEKRADITGTFEMQAHLKAKGTIDDIANTLNGSFTMTAKNGKILKSQSLDKTLDLLNETENFKGRFPDLDKEIISYHSLTIRGRLQEHRLEVAEGILDAQSLIIFFRGQLELYKRTLDLNVLVSPFKTVHRIVRKIPILGYIVSGNLVSIPVKIQGDIKDPEVTFLSPSVIGSEFLGIIERIIKLPITLIEPVFSD